MRIELKNIGKIKAANIEINGITVIAGVNDTGKSTIGKTLFALFNGLFNVEKKIRKDKISAVHKHLRRVAEFMELPSSTILSRIYSAPLNKVNLHHLSKKIVDDKLDEDLIMATLKDNYFNIIQPNEEINEIDINVLCSRINKIVNITPIESTNLILKRYLHTEFNGQINNVFNHEDGTINLEIKKKLLQLSIVDNEVYLKDDLLFNITDDIVYIDDPFVLDDLDHYNLRMNYMGEYYGHRTHLLNQLQPDNKSNVIEELINQGQLQNVIEQMNMICPGQLRSKQNFVEYSIDGLGVNVRNLSAGLKTFTILKELIINNVINQNGTIILDEPEIHLHPAWQLVLAELIVLLQIEFDLHILLTTHSPYFLNAIEVYTEKYKIKDKIKYYLSDCLDNSVIFNDVTNDIEKIYMLLAKPLQDLEDMRYK